MKKHLMINISAFIVTFVFCTIATVCIATNSSGVSLSYALESTEFINETIQNGIHVIPENIQNDDHVITKIDYSNYYNPDEVDLEVVSIRKYNNVDDFTISNDTLLQMEMANSNYNKKTFSSADLIKSIEESIAASIVEKQETTSKDDEIQLIVEEEVEESLPVVKVELPEGYQEKFANWYSVNTDIQGWLKLDGTKLDYPIMQTKDDFYYLNRNLYKESDVWGIPYMSSYCTTDESTNTILYGHSRDATGEQLSALKNYRNIEFYKQNPVIEFDTVYGDGDYKIIAYFIENTDEANPFFRYHEFINQTDPDYINNFIEQSKLRSYINTTVDYLPTDKFLTISTCEDTNTSNYNRLVLVARKVREGESIFVDTSTATQNNN